VAGNIRIVTPNHGLIVDTFIIYGLVRTISEGEKGSYFIEKFLIKPEGEYYSIEISEEIIQEIGETFYNNLYEAFKNDVDLSRSKSWRLGILFQNEEKILNDLLEFLENLKDEKVLNVFDLFQRPSTWEEWRSNRCKNHIKELKKSPKIFNLIKPYTVQISLSPQLGKYLYNFDRGVSPNQQKVCPLCASLSILGLLSYSVRMILMEGKRASGWQFVVVIPTMDTCAKEINLFRGAFGKTDELIVQPLSKMPEIITPLLLFKGVDTFRLMVLLQTRPILFSYRFEPSPGKPNVMAVRKISEYPASRFIEFYLKVRERSSGVDWRLLDRMSKFEYSPYFSELSLSIMTRDPDRFYNFLRGLASEIMRRENRKEFFSEAFVEQALRFYGKPG
jgi:hypothetical protein